MGKTLAEIAQQLKDSDKKVQLIYAFNGTGKTRLSREFKELIAPKNDEQFSSRDKILYYNAFTEDLFYWDNDLEYDMEPKLNIQQNAFTDWIFTEQGQDQNIIDYFHYYSSYRLTPHFNEEFSAVTFSLERGNDEHTKKIKISKGEESNFIWSIFYVLIEQVVATLNVSEEERENEKFNQLEYIFIDDPVSSLDENHLIQLAIDLAALINSNQSQVKFIITTHNTIFYNVLFNELELNKKRKGSCYLLQSLPDGTFELQNKRGDSNSRFSYHLHLKFSLQQAIEANSIQKYHFILLRNLYEKTANFLGYEKWSQLLPNDKDNVRQKYAIRIMNFYSHSTLSNESIAEPNEQEKAMVKYLLDHLLKTYSFYNVEETNNTNQSSNNTTGDTT